MSDAMQTVWQELRDKAGPYPREAYDFVRAGLTHTVQMIHGESAAESEDDSRHVSGKQLCLGLRDYATHRYGRLARTVLSRWGVHSTEDFGRIVYAMVDAGLMRTSEGDSFEEFRGVFDFDEGFAD
ncbi:MAG: hypothetical protein DYG93_12270 [Leptolyngbya sp. PLA2]|nr:hypothetical protein [Leptolyngbya sp.]MCE7972419.1 hypothetical protein [Leptolyngbya sp. PL-A2]MDL1905818.1 hypothetical protein [Synechococcales cyanobacterium CNB]GIK19390.1 MAG: hypothetical protein BroJett004_15540 [Planctomycetota bacterium]